MFSALLGRDGRQRNIVLFAVCRFFFRDEKWFASDATGLWLHKSVIFKMKVAKYAHHWQSLSQ